MSFTDKNVDSRINQILPDWVQTLAERFPQVDFSALQNVRKTEDYPLVILEFQHHFEAEKALENCSFALQSFFPNQQIVYRFERWNRPLCKNAQHQILKRFDLRHTAEYCQACAPGYGCRSSETVSTGEAA